LLETRRGKRHSAAGIALTILMTSLFFVNSRSFVTLIYITKLKWFENVFITNY